MPWSLNHDSGVGPSCGLRHSYRGPVRIDLNADLGEGFGDLAARRRRGAAATSSPARTSPAASTPATRSRCGGCARAAAARRGDRRPGRLPRPRRVRPPAHGRRAGRSRRRRALPARRARRASPARRAPGCATSSRTARCTTPPPTIRCRRRRSSPAVARLRRDTAAARRCPARRMAAAAHEAGLPFVAEAFADRAYLAAGRLVPRSDDRRGPRTTRTRSSPGPRASRLHRAVTATDGTASQVARPLAVPARRHAGRGAPGAGGRAAAGRRRGDARSRSRLSRCACCPTATAALLVEPDDPAQVLALRRRARAPSRTSSRSCRRRAPSWSVRDTAGRRGRASASGRRLRDARGRRRRHCRRADGPAGRARRSLRRRRSRRTAAELGLSADELVGRAQRRRLRRRVLRVRAGLRLPDRPGRAAARRPPAPSRARRVPAGSVGIAGEFTGVYPRASPGGWRLLGRPTRRCGTPTATRRRCCAPGTRVRFRAPR